MYWLSCWNTPKGTATPECATAFFAWSIFVPELPDSQSVPSATEQEMPVVHHLKKVEKAGLSQPGQALVFFVCYVQSRCSVGRVCGERATTHGLVQASRHSTQAGDCITERTPAGVTSMQHG